jgi:hypothetical protein
LKKPIHFVGIFIALAGFAVLFSFQNCTPPEFASTSAPHDDITVGSIAASNNTSGSGTGNGQGYDGKPTTYVLLLDGEAVCVDGSSVKSRIDITNSNVASLVRDNCVTLATPRILAANEFSIVSLSAITYAGFILNSVAIVPYLPPPSTPTFTVMYTCVNASSSITIQAGVDTTRGPMVRFNRSYASSTYNSGLYSVARSMPSGEIDKFVGSNSVGDDTTLEITATIPNTKSFSGQITATFSSAAGGGIDSEPVSCNSSP